MTEESPLTICHRCQTPIARPDTKIRGEYYCRDCAPAALDPLEHVTDT